MNKRDIFQELDNEIENSIKTLHTINPNISVSTDLFSFTMSVHVKGQVVFSAGLITINGFLLGMIEHHKIQQKI